MSDQSVTSTDSSTSSASLTSNQSFEVPRGLKFFSKPKMIIFRFLDVIKSKHNLLVEMITYARSHLHDFLVRYWTRAELVDLIEELRNQSFEDKAANDQTPEIFSPPAAVQAIRDSILLYVNWKCSTEHNRIDIGHDEAPLQKLLHWVILEGFIDDAFCITIPENFVATFRRLKAGGITLLILSTVTHELHSGTRLLSKTDQGDLSGFFLYFDHPTDTRIKDTYLMFPQFFKRQPAEILFVGFSDTECKKAARAGLRVVKIKQRNQTRPKYPNITVVNDITEIHFLS